MPPVLIQKSFFHPTQSFEFAGDDIIKVQIKSFGKLSEFSLNIAGMNPYPLRRKNADYSWLAGVAVFGLFMALSMFGIYSMYPNEDYAPFFIVLFLFLIPFFISLWKFFKSWYDMYIFSNQYSGDTLAFYYEKPDSKTFNDFIDELKKRLIKCGSFSGNMNVSISFELRELSEIFKEGRITEEEYNRLKNRIIDGSDTKSRIGFFHEDETVESYIASENLNDE